MKTHRLFGLCRPPAATPFANGPARWVWLMGLLWLGISALAPATLRAQTLAQVDPAKSWQGYMNVFNLPADGGGYQFGSAWGAGDLRATFVGGTNLVLQPCTNVWETTNTYWVKADGVSPNKNMDASFYVQDDTLVGQNLTFVGTCLSNTLTGDYSSQAFIKIFDGGYNLLASVTTNLIAGQFFSITLAAVAGAVHVQYGFETVGPDANPATADSLGQVVIAVPVGVTVVTDPAKFWAGYMAWAPVDPGSAYGGYGAGAWGVADLRAIFTQTNLVLLPNTNTYNPTDPYWVNTNADTGANIMTASCYVTDDTIVNTNVIFTGYCRSYTLASNYTAYAFIKMFNSDYSAYLGGAYSGQLVGGQSFAISLVTTGAAHVQYGYEMVGPNANPATADSLGQVVLALSAPVAPPTVLAEPTNNAPAPALPAWSVISMYNSSGVYTDSPGISWYATWGAVASQGDYTITNTSRIVKKYAGLQYCGIEFYANPINVTGYDMLHLDIWTPNANQLGIKLVSLTAGTQDPQVNIPPSSGLITSNHWVGLDIPLSAFKAVRPDWDPSNLQQMLLVDNSTAGPGIQGGTFYVDNVYFYTAPSLAAGISGGQLTLSVPTRSGVNYTVQYKTNLTDATWQTLTNFTGDGSTPILSEPLDQPSRFYRLMIQ
ncbi:MAG TPA: hypothetical protein VFB55_08335 [Verrucomicrobiae bacterium]|nr:hypothetical protein [Verrucomicrobiae bacterium]